MFFKASRRGQALAAGLCGVVLLLSACPDMLSPPLTYAITYHANAPPVAQPRGRRPRHMIKR